MAEDGQDLFGRILKCCKLTESQEAKLLNCPFARDSEKVTDSIPLTQFSSMTQSEADHIVILTAPESQSSAGESILEEDSVFHTPPEHHLSSSEDQNPNVDDRRRQLLDDEQESQRVRDDEYDSQTVSLGQTPNARMRKIRALDNEPESKRIRAVAGGRETEIEEDDDVDSTEVVDLSDSERAEGGGLVKDGVELGEIGGENCDSVRSLRGKAVEECAEMPKDGGERIEELGDGRMEDNDVVGLFGMVDKLTAIFGFPDAGEHVDFLETAKEKGMVFPKPRWHQES